jgi:hypothetical protein
MTYDDEEVKSRSLKLPKLAVYKPRDSQIGPVAELSSGSSYINCTLHTHVLHIVMFDTYIYMPQDAIYKVLQYFSGARAWYWQITSYFR